MKYGMTVFLMMFTLGRAHGDDVLRCPAIPTSNSAQSVITVSSLHLSSNHESTSLYVDLLNMQTKPITGLVMFVELSDDAGRYMTSIPFFTRGPRFTGSLAQKLDGYLKAYDELKLRSGLIPGQKESYSGWSPVIVTRCPAAAQVDLLEFETSDGTISQNREAEWIANPVLTEAGYMRPTFSPPSSVRFFATIRVDQNGNGFLEKTDAAGQTKIWFQDILRFWKFVPATANGEPKEAEIALLFRIDDDATSYTERFWFQSEEPPPTAILVRMADYGSAGAMVFQGGKEVHSSIGHK
jgi:hypothetical protein